MKIDGRLRRNINFQSLAVSRNCKTCVTGYYDGGIYRCGRFPLEIEFGLSDPSKYVCSLWAVEDADDIKG